MCETAILSGWKLFLGVRARARPRAWRLCTREGAIEMEGGAK